MIIAGFMVAATSRIRAMGNWKIMADGRTFPTSCALVDVGSQSVLERKEEASRTGRLFFIYKVLLQIELRYATKVRL
jgi:hypothetical protein